MIAPSTNVYLLKSPLEINDQNQLDFKNKNDQFNYFFNLPKLSGDGLFTYQRKDNVLRFGDGIDNLYQYNYVMYQNENHSNKWFYAYIDRMEYINDNMTNIYLSTDTFQTWQFDLNYKPTFIDREHTNNDAIGSNLIEESLELGEYKVQDTWNIELTGKGKDKAIFVAIGVSELPDSSWKRISGFSMPSGCNTYNGIAGGLTYLVTVNDPASIREITDVYSANTKSDAIVNMFIIPYAYVNKANQDQLLDWTTCTIDGVSRLIFFFKNTEEAIRMANITSYAPTTIDSYKPRNQKLLTFPFCYNRVTNNGGTDVIYRWEDFKNRTAKYSVYGSITQGMSIKLVPQQYLGTNGETDAWEYGITGQKLPVISWNSDFYLSWVNQQGNNLAIQTATNVGNTMLGGIVGGAMAGGVAGVAGSLVGTGLNLISSVANSMQKIHEAELVPDQARGNVNSGDVNFSKNKSGFTLYDMSIKRQFAERIDSYFDMFGYKTNMVKIPNIKGRKNWNYVKTLACYIDASIPQEDLAKIKSNFDSGITIWHNPSTFMDYSKDNSII